MRSKAERFKFFDNNMNVNAQMIEQSIRNEKKGHLQ